MLCAARERVDSPHALMGSGLYAPKYWPTWLALGVLRSLEPLPEPLQMRLGVGLGKFLRRLPTSWLRIARRNIALCLPELSAEQQSALLDRHCESLGMALFETANTWWSDDARILRHAEIVGLEHLRAALAQGRGAIMIGGHFTTIEIATRILSAVVPMSAVYRPPKNPVLARAMLTSFEAHGIPIAYDDIRTMIRVLRKNGVVWYAPDQSYRNKGAAMVDFFGIPAATTTATSRLAQISGAAVLTYFPERLPGNARYRVTIGPAFENFPGDDPAEDAARFARLLEAHIRKVPEQYFWVHRRFKGLSADYPDYYGRDSR
jgi:KDO2-lipid IV(A) lauroyltransferase